MEWHPFYYKGQETNIEVNKFGEARRVPKDWMKYKVKARICKKVLRDGYYVVSCNIENLGTKQFGIHQIIAVVYLNHKFSGMKKVVDHIDENKLNNKLENLQIVTSGDNVSKSFKYRKSVGLVCGRHRNTFTKGYSFVNNQYRASICYNGVQKHLGRFSTPEEATAAYQEALRKINAGEFATN